MTQRTYLERTKPMRVASIGFLALASTIATASDAIGQAPWRTVTIEVTVDAHKPNGAAWDAFGGAPDVALCTNSALGQRCYGGGGLVAGPGQFSRGRCQDAFNCTFTVEVPTSGPIGLTIYDVDVSSHDTVGACHLPNSRSAGRCGSATINAQ